VNRDARFSRHVLIAWILWAVSLLLPAAGIRQGGALIRNDVLLPGWQVALAAESEPLRGMSVAGRIAVRIMGLTNLLMLVSPVTEVVRRRAVRQGFLVLAIGAAGLNASALLFNFASLLSYGYWVWLTSFIVLASTLWRYRSLRRD